MFHFGRAARIAALTTISAATMALSSAPASAAVFTTTFNADLMTTPVTFSFNGGSFTFSSSGDWFSPLNISTGGTGAVRTVFGQPSTDFPDRGTVIYGPDTLGGFASFPDTTNIRFSNGGNLLGLRVTFGGEDFYGFARTTDNILNSISFETVGGVPINATAVLAVPEPATWAMLILGFGVTGAALRRRRNAVRLHFA